jgi:hypothetical protein
MVGRWKRGVCPGDGDRYGHHAKRACDTIDGPGCPNVEGSTPASSRPARRATDGKEGGGIRMEGRRKMEDGSIPG